MIEFGIVVLELRIAIFCSGVCLTTSLHPPPLVLTCALPLPTHTVLQSMRAERKLFSSDQNYASCCLNDESDQRCLGSMDVSSSHPCVVPG